MKGEGMRISPAARTPVVGRMKDEGRRGKGASKK